MSFSSLFIGISFAMSETEKLAVIFNLFQFPFHLDQLCDGSQPHQPQHLTHPFSSLFIGISFAITLL